jgi:hypothetical protein
VTADDALSRLRAGLDEDEQIAREALSPESLSGWIEKEEHDFRHKPPSVLRQVAALRKVLAVCDAIDSAALDGEWWELGKYSGFADDIREALAGIYAEPIGTEGGIPA